MGLVIKIEYGFTWSRTYFVQDLDETRAKKKAYEMARQSSGYYFPDTLEEAEKNENSITIEVVAKIEQIIL